LFASPAQHMLDPNFLLVHSLREATRYSSTPDDSTVRNTNIVTFYLWYPSNPF
jgi:hypothetical protein